MNQTTYVMVKPGFASKPEVIREIAKRLIAKGLKLEFRDYIRYTRDTAKMHYAEHVGKDFYPKLETYITSGKAYGMIVSGENAIAIVRALAGATKNPAEGTIRYDIPKMLNLPCRTTENVIHSSDSAESAEREIKIYNLIQSRNEIQEYLPL